MKDKIENLVGNRVKVCDRRTILCGNVARCANRYTVNTRDSDASIVFSHTEIANIKVEFGFTIIVLG